MINKQKSKTALECYSNELRISASNENWQSATGNKLTTFWSNEQLSGAAPVRQRHYWRQDLHENTRCVAMPSRIQVIGPPVIAPRHQPAP